MFAEDSVFEEAIIAEYALVINGHSLVRYNPNVFCFSICLFISFLMLQILSHYLLVAFLLNVVNVAD